MIDQKADLMFLTETWCKPNKSAVLNELTPPGYSFIGECRSLKRGGGVGLLYKSAYKFCKTKTKRYDTFEHLDVKSTQTARPVRIVIIYRPPTTPIQSFLDEFATFVNEIAVTVRVYTVFSFFVFKFANEKRITNSFFVFRFQISERKTKNEFLFRFSFSKVK